MRQLDDSFPVGPAGHGEDNIAGQIVLVVIPPHLLGRHRPDAVDRAQHRLAERMPREMSLHHVVVGDGRWLIGIHADLFQNDLLLHVKVVLAQRRKQNA